jgi:AbrB family looped-hinge helix DNA binding protein
LAQYSSITSKGQVTIPAAIRRLLGLKPRDRVAFTVEDGEVRVRAVRSVVRELYQSVPALDRDLDVDEMIRIAAEEHAQDVAREGL